MATVFWDCRGVILCDFMPWRKTINPRIIVILSRNYSEQSINSAQWNSFAACQHLSTHCKMHTRVSCWMQWEVFKHPPYNPDLSTSWLSLYVKLKEFLDGTIRKVHQARSIKHIFEWVNGLLAEFYKEGAQTLVVKNSHRKK